MGGGKAAVGGGRGCGWGSEGWEDGGPGWPGDLLSGFSNTDGITPTSLAREGSSSPNHVERYMFTQAQHPAHAAHAGTVDVYCCGRLVVCAKSIRTTDQLFFV